MQLMAELRGDAWTKEARDRVLGALDFPAQALKRPVREYSKGMTQKVGLAAALLSGAALTVLDEPMSGLDPVARITMRDALTTLRSGNRALVFTTHSLHDLEHLCDRMAVIHHGRLCFHGTPEALCRTFGEQTLEPAFIACLREAEHRAG
ncbi:MAG: AAA family ATPase [Burkholderiaceae bacterium]